MSRFVALIAVAVVALVSACAPSLLGDASILMTGGSLASVGYQPLDVVVSYRAEGSVPKSAEYLLVRTEKGEAIFERSPDGSGTLIDKTWSDEKGDHFAMWILTSHAYEFLVPKDRSKPAQRYIYPAGFYSIVDVGGGMRPVAAAPLDPVATLIPNRTGRRTL